MIKVLCCAECNNPLITTTGRGSYCLHCGYPPSMQDTYFIDMEEKQPAEKAAFKSKDIETVLFDGFIQKVEITPEGMDITLRDAEGSETKIMKPSMFKAPKVGPNCRLVLIAAEELV